jgi:hypothetical protein
MPAHEFRRPHSGLFAAALIAAYAFQAMAATAAERLSQTDAEAAKQESIYRSRGEKVPSGYIVGRGLAKYAELLPTGFDAALKSLGPADRWLDIGAGSGQAILDYYAPEFGRLPDRPEVRPYEKARSVAVSIEDRRTGAWEQRSDSLAAGQIQYLFGKRLREYSPQELGKFRMITDVYGGFSYTENLSLFLEKVLDSLELEGSFFSLLQSVKLEDGKDAATTWYLTELVDASGRDLKVCAWLKSVACVKVSCESKSAWDAPTELIHVQKVCNAVHVPALVRLHYEAGTPPGRRFQLAR